MDHGLFARMGGTHVLPVLTELNTTSRTQGTRLVGNVIHLLIGGTFREQVARILTY